MEREIYAETFAVEDWHWWYTARRRIIARALADRLAPAGREREILDIGCGTGGNLAALARFGRVTGVDSSEEAAGYCRRRGYPDIVVAPPGPLPFEDARFDVAAALDVAEHAQDDAAFVAETRRILRPGGTLVLTVPAFPFLWGPHDDLSHHYRRYRARGLRRLLEVGGLRVTHVSHFNTLLFPPIAAVRLLRRVVRRGQEEPASDLAMSRPGRVNDVLARAFALEAPAVSRFGLPFGVSLLALAEVAEHAVDVEAGPSVGLHGRV